MHLTISKEGNWDSWPVKLNTKQPHLQLMKGRWTLEVKQKQNGVTEHLTIRTEGNRESWTVKLGLKQTHL